MFEQFFAVWQHSTPACSIWISSDSLHRGFILLQKHSLELKQKFNQIWLNSGRAFLNFYLATKTPNRICTILLFHKKKTIMVKLAIIQFWIKSLCFDYNNTFIQGCEYIYLRWKLQACKKCVLTSFTSRSIITNLKVRTRWQRAEFIWCQ